MKRLSILLVLLGIAVSMFAKDIIILKNSNKIEAVIQEVSPSEIKYKKASNADGPTFIISTSEVNSVVYSNGDVQVFAEDNQQQVSNDQQQTNDPSYKLKDAQSFYSITINYSYYKFKNDFEDLPNLNGFNAGFMAQNRMYKNIVMLWGIEYQFGYCNDNETGKWMNHNLKIPVRIGFSVPFATTHSATVFFGPSFDFNVSTVNKFKGREFNDKGYLYKESGTIDFVSGKYDVSYSGKTGSGNSSGKDDSYKALKVFDIPLGLGAMYKYKNFGIRLQYEWGLVNRAKGEWSDYKIKADQFTIGVFFSF